MRAQQTKRGILRAQVMAIVWAVGCLLAELLYLVPGTGHNDSKTALLGVGALAMSVLYEILAEVKSR